MTTDTTAKFNDMLKDFDVAMFVTTTARGELRSRPMVIADHEENGDILFITGDDSAKIQELLLNTQVNVAMQSSNRFLSLSGTAAISHDRERIKQCWKPAWKAWFPEGSDDPNISLIRVVAHQGEYWDNAGFKAVQFWIEAGKAIVKGERFDDDHKSLHGKVTLNT